MRTKQDFQGGLSDRLFNQPEIQAYITVFGWMGHEGRTAELDKALEKALKDARFNQALAAAFLCSRYGRHLGDATTFGNTLEEKTEIIRKYVRQPKIRRDLEKGK